MADDTQNTGHLQTTITLNWMHLAFTAIIAAIVAIAPDLLANQFAVVNGLDQLCQTIATLPTG